MARRIYSRTLSSGRNNQLMQQLQNEADRMLEQFRNDLAREVLKQTQQAALEIGSAGSEGGSGDSSAGDGASAGNYTRLILAAAKYIFRAKPHTSTQETSRSAAAQQQFRLSQSQAAALASAQLARGQKNS